MAHGVYLTLLGYTVEQFNWNVRYTADDIQKYNDNMIS